MRPQRALRWRPPLSNDLCPNSSVILPFVLQRATRCQHLHICNSEKHAGHTRQRAVERSTCTTSNPGLPMKVQSSTSVRLAALSFTLYLMSGYVTASTVGTVATSTDCIPAFLGDGNCDLPNNTADYGFESGCSNESTLKQQSS